LRRATQWQHEWPLYGATIIEFRIGVACLSKRWKSVSCRNLGLREVEDHPSNRNLSNVRSAMQQTVEK
jgi:hypothetical protein